ncbi:MAG: hypothetical protein STHCBS139747_002708 [Sporothrix thermara]
MRLLHTSSLKFRDFTDAATIPKYAILSHTWEDKQEVTLQDMASVYLADKRGHAKIERTCELAREHGYEWAWIDTCCIDKTNNTELTESINSMFRWYQNAAVCFVYLADLNAQWCDKSGDGSVPMTNGIGEENGVDVHARMRACAWFRRGWTLQELLAPATIEFYDARWKLVGTKTDLAPLLADITRIPEPAIRGQEPVSRYSAAQIMAWASPRVTRKVEDEAYCLLGLFDVYMPLIYGEGKRAFQRLQEEILKRTTDLTLFAWVPADEAAVLDIETAQSVSSLSPSQSQSQSQSQSPPRTSAYMPLLASTPAQFAHCHGLSYFRNDDTEFAVTNRGLRISTYLVLVSQAVETNEQTTTTATTATATSYQHQNQQQHTRYRYVLSVGFSRRAASEIGIWLKKIGPGLFLRDAHPPLAFLSKRRLPYTNTTENLTFYIIPQPVSSISSSQPPSSASLTSSPMSPHTRGFESPWPPSLRSSGRPPPQPPLVPAIAAQPSPAGPHIGLFASANPAGNGVPSAQDVHKQLCSVYHPRLFPRGLHIPDLRDRGISFGYFSPQPWDESTRIYCHPESRNDVVAFSCASHHTMKTPTMTTIVDKLSFGVLVDYRIKRGGPRCLVISRHHTESRMLFVQAMRQQSEPLRWYALENELPLIATSSNVLRQAAGTSSNGGGDGDADTRMYEIAASVVDGHVQIGEHSVVMPTLDIQIRRV